MKFIADVMLGRLAKRMRLLGYDVFYDSSLNDNGVIRQALEQQRVILTRDRGLANRPSAKNHLFIRSDGVDNQLREVIQHFSLSPAGALSRCSVCNNVLEEMARNGARDRVPEYVYRHSESFLQCTKCGRIYWRGTHVLRMRLRSRIQ
jgi:uncharacterized protein with PIN domain